MEHVPTTESEFYDAFERDCVRERPGDDMLFYVRADFDTCAPTERVFVRRFTAPATHPPPRDASVSWEHTYYLNLIVNHMTYHLDFKIYRKNAAAPAAAAAAGKATYTVLHARREPIYAAPNHIAVHDARGKDAQEVLWTYPEIYFTLHNHELASAANPPLSNANEYVAINLEAEGAFFGEHVRRVELFRGAAPYDAVRRAYNELRAASRSPSKRRSGDGGHGHYLTLRGPRGKGKAQMSVTPGEANGGAAAAAASGASQEVQSGGGGGGDGGGGGSSWLASGVARAAKQLTFGMLGGGGGSGGGGDLTPHDGPMRCSLTYCALPWEAIVADVNRAWIKKHAKEAEKAEKSKSKR